MSSPEQEQSFPGQFDDAFPVGPEEGNGALFGRDVLRGLVEGIDDFVEMRQPRWRQFRSLGPAALGCAMWIDDPALLRSLEKLSGACVVVTKQGRSERRRRELAGLHGFNERASGLPLRAFPVLGGIAPKADGRPVVIGPHDRVDDVWVPSIRTLGYRKRAGPWPPIMHAKLVLLGSLWWHDEGSVGVEDVVGFTPRRLWVSSANLTRASRRSLEWGYWTEDAALVKGAERFLLRLVRFSEDLDPQADAFDPELAPVEFDQAAMAEAFAEMELGDEGGGM